MAIKVPLVMVYYSERDANAVRLLCWIPPDRYQEVAADNAALERLQTNYPQGFEVRVCSEDLEAEGINLPVNHDDLVKTYLALEEKGLLNEMGMVIAENLENKARAFARGESIDSIVDDEGESADTGREPLRGTPLEYRKRLTDLPPMKGDEEPLQVFQRISVRQEPINLENN